MSAWKDLERRIAKALGGTRTGPLGKRGSDVAGAPFAVECKRTSRPPMQRWVEQARRQGVDEGKPWLLVVAGHNDRRPIVVMDFYELVELAQRAGALGEINVEGVA